MHSDGIRRWEPLPLRGLVLDINGLMLMCRCRLLFVAEDLVPSTRRCRLAWAVLPLGAGDLGLRGLEMGMVWPKWEPCGRPRREDSCASRRERHQLRLSEEVVEQASVPKARSRCARGCWRERAGESWTRRSCLLEEVLIFPDQQDALPPRLGQETS